MPTSEWYFFKVSVWLAIVWELGLLVWVSGLLGVPGILDHWKFIFYWTTVLSLKRHPKKYFSFTLYSLLFLKSGFKCSKKSLKLKSWTFNNLFWHCQSFGRLRSKSVPKRNNRAFIIHSSFINSSGMKNSGISKYWCAPILLKLPCSS